MKVMVQFIWYKILDKIIKPGKPILDNPVLGELSKMLKQLRFYNLFGVRVIWWGDSNVQKGSTFYIMSKFKLLTVNLGRGGSYAHHWLKAFITKIGKILLKLMKKKINIINLGGNYILKGQMDIAYEGLKGIRDLLPTSYMVNVPPIHAEIIAEIMKMIPDFPYKTAQEVNTQVEILNQYINSLWGSPDPLLNQVIDIHSILDNEIDGVKIWWFALADIVHFNEKAYRHVYVKMVNAIMTILQKLRVVK